MQCNQHYFKKCHPSLFQKNATQYSLVKIISIQRVLQISPVYTSIITNFIHQSRLHTTATYQYFSGFFYNFLSILLSFQLSTPLHVNMLVEEVPKLGLKNTSTIYFLSLVSLLARPYFKNDSEDANRASKNRPKVNYNLTDLLNAQTQANYNSGTVASGVFKSSQQMQLERLISKRLGDLSKETPASNFELPKTFGYTSIHKNVSAADKKKIRVGNTPSTKRILAARRNLNSYFEEEKNLISINTILGVNFSFAEQNENLENALKKRRIERLFKPKVKLCCICGSSSSYSRCESCGQYSCSVRCRRLHQELRCT